MVTFYFAVVSIGPGSEKYYVEWTSTPPPADGEQLLTDRHWRRWDPEAVYDDYKDASDAMRAAIQYVSTSSQFRAVAEDPKWRLRGSACAVR